MNFNRVLVWGLLPFMMLISGCATIVDGRTQEVTFQTSPEGATVSVDGRIMGRTPLTVRLDRKGHQSALITKPGYRTETRRLTSLVNGWFWGNIPLGIIPGMLVDSFSGAVNELYPSQYFVTLGLQHMLGEALDREQRIARAKEYLTQFHRQIFADIAKNGGPHLSKLMLELDIPAVNQLDAIDRMKSMATLYTDVPTYADRLVDDLMDHGYSSL